MEGEEVIKYIEVRSCDRCPYSKIKEYKKRFLHGWCDNQPERIGSKPIEREEDYYSFPGWCPLKNLKK